jgi:DNA-binding transcriptional ArsR family regulator
MEIENTKPSLSVEQLEIVSEMIKAIAHPARIGILNLLTENEKLTVTELHTRLGLDQATASRHLGIMRTKGILATKREGTKIYYYLKNKGFMKIMDCLSVCACNEQ